MPAKADWTGWTVERLQQDPEVQNLSPKVREEVYDDFLEFHGASTAVRGRQQAQQKLDYRVFHSDGLSKVRARSEANEFRNLLRETEKAEAAGAGPEAFLTLRTAYLDRLRGIGQVHDEERAKRPAAVDAAGKLDRIRQQPEFGRATSVGEALRSEARGFEDILKSSGIDPAITDAGDGTGSVSDAFRGITADAKALADFKGPTITQSSQGEWRFSPFQALRDPEGTKKAIREGVPRLAADKLLEGFDAQRGEIGKSFRSSLSDKTLLDADISKIDAENTVLKKRGLKSRSQAARQGISEEVENDIAAEIVQRYIETEEGKSDFSRFVDANVASIEGGFSSIGRIPAALGTLVGSETAQRGLESAALQDQFEGAADQLKPDVGGFTEKTAALTGELFPLAATIASGGLGGAAARKLSGAVGKKLSREAVAKVSGAVASAFGGTRSAAGVTEELLALQKDGGSIRRAAALSFGMTTLSTLAFNKFGVGGVEQFRAAKGALTAQVAKSLRQKFTELGKTVGKGAIGEYTEEYIQGYAEALIANAEKFWTEKKTPSEIAKEAELGAFVGGLLGGGHSAPRAVATFATTPTAEPAATTPDRSPEAVAAADAVVTDEEQKTAGQQTREAIAGTDTAPISDAAPSVEDTGTQLDSDEEVERKANAALAGQAAPEGAPDIVTTPEPVDTKFDGVSDVELARSVEAAKVSRANPFSDEVVAEAEANLLLLEAEQVRRKAATPEPSSVDPESQAEFLEKVKGIPITVDGVEVKITEVTFGQDNKVSSVTVSSPGGEPRVLDGEAAIDAASSASDKNVTEKAEKALGSTPTPKVKTEAPIDQAPVKEKTAPEAAPEKKLTKRQEARRDEANLKRVNIISDRVAGTSPNTTKDAVTDALNDQIIKDPETPDALLTTIGKRAASKGGVTRKGERQAKKEGRVGTLDTGTPVVDSNILPDEFAALSSNTDALNKAIDTLSPQEQAAIRGTAEGKSDAEIAKEQNTTPKSIANARSRARTTLKGLIATERESKGKTDDQVLEQVRASLRSDPQPRAQKAADKIKVSKKDNAQTRAAKKIAKFFGRRVVVVNGLDQNGLFTPDVTDAIIISSKAGRAETLVMFHELLHSLKATNPKAYAKLNKAVDADLDAYIKKFPARREGTKAAVKEEFLADFLADRATDPEFWKTLAKKDKSLFNTLKDALRGLLKKIREGNLGTEAFVRDLEAADAALAEALISLKKGGEAQLTPEDGARTAFEEALPKGFHMEFVGESFDGDFEMTPDQDSQLNTLVADSGIAILSGKELNQIVLDSSDNVVGAIYTEFSDGEFSFDVIVSKEQQGKKLGSFLLDLGISEGNQETEFGEFGSIVLDVVNPKLVEPLKRRGFTVDEEIHGHVIMSLGSDSDTRFEEQLDQMNKLQVSQTAGSDNPFWSKDGVSYNEAEEIIASITGFKWQEVSTDVKGQKEAEQFLISLLDPETQLEMQEALVNANYSEDRKAIAIGLARASYFAYAVRVSESDAQGAASLFEKGFILAKDIKVMFDAQGGVDASQIGAVLRSFRNLAGGNIISLFAANMNGVERFVDAKFKTDVAKVVAAVEGARIEAETNRGEDFDATTKISEDAVLGAVDPAALASLKRAEKKVKQNMRDILKLVRNLQTAAKTKFEESLDSIIDRFEGELDSDLDLETLTDTMDAMMGALESEVTAPLFDKIKTKADTAKKRKNAATKKRESATGTTKTKNQVDILGKRTIGAAERATNEVEKKTNELLKPFNELLTKGLGKDEFITAYVKLGGTAEVGADVFAANDTLQTIKAAKDKAKKVVSEAEQARKQVAALVDRVENADPKAKSKTSKKTLSGVFGKLSKRVAPVTRGKFNDEMRAIRNANGEPFYTAEQVDQVWGLLQKARAEETAKRDAAKAVKDTESQENKARKIFKAPLTEAEKTAAKEKKAKAPRTLQQFIMDEVINNPARQILNKADRLKLAEEILAERTDLTPAQIKKIAAEVEGKLDTLLEAKKVKIADPILKALQDRGGLTSKQINQAIRLQVLNPSKGFATSIAALSGWDGLTGVEMRELAKLEAQMTKVGQNTGFANRARKKQMRIISKSTGLAPLTKKLIQSYIRGAMYSSTGSQFLGFFVSAGVFNLTLAANIGRITVDPRIPLGEKIKQIADLHRSAARSLGRAGREFRSVWATGGSTSFEQLQGGQEIESRGNIHVDPLTTLNDIATAELDKLAKEYDAAPVGQKKRRIAKRLGLRFKKWVIAGQRITFVGLSSADAAGTRAVASLQAQALADRRAFGAGLTSEGMRAIRDDITNHAAAYTDYLRDDVGIETENEIAMMVQDRIEGAIFQEYAQTQGIETDKLVEEAVLNMQDMIGVGQTNRSPIGGVTDWFAKGANAAPVVGPLLFPAVRTVGNVTDFLMWTVPIVGAVRAIRTSGQSDRAVAYREKFSNINAEWQFAQRRNLAIASHLVTGVAMAMLKMNEGLDDEDKWFDYNGFYPVKDKAERERWDREGIQEHELRLFGSRIRLDRGFGQSFWFPMVFASTGLKVMERIAETDEAEKDRLNKGLFSDAVGLGMMVVPGASSAEGNVRATTSWENFRKFGLQKLSALAPFSGALKTPRRLGERIDNKATTQPWYKAAYSPFYVDTDAEGVVLYRNSLFEPMETSRNLWEGVRKLGIPFYMDPVKRGRDPKAEKLLDFRETHRIVGGVQTRTKWAKDAEAFGIENTNENFNKWGEAYAKNYIDSFARLGPKLPEDLTNKEAATLNEKMTAASKKKTLRDLGYGKKPKAAKKRKLPKVR